MDSGRGHAASESTPLLGNQEDSDGSRRYGDDGPEPGDSLDTPTSVEPKKGRQLGWPAIVALLLLCLAVIAALCLGFTLPSVIKEYAQAAAVVEPLSVAIASFTPGGVRTRIQASFILDASRVESQHVRDLGRLGTWLAKEVETGESQVQIYLPEYGNILLGTASIPPIKVNIRNGHYNELDFFADLSPGDVDGIRVVGNDWLAGRLGQLRIKGLANVPLRSGLLDLGSQTLSESFVLQDRNLPNFPSYNITKLNIHNITEPDSQAAMVVNVSVSIQNDYPVNLTLPALSFQILVPNCNLDDRNIHVANATTDVVNVEPRTAVVVSAGALVHQLPDELTTICPGRASSPLDLLVRNYIQGLETTIYIGGGSFQSSNAPQWMGDMLNNLTLPVPFTSHGFSRLIKRFSMTHVHFQLPAPSAEPGTPEAQPRVSSLVQVAVGLPKEMNFPLNITRVRSKPDVYYQSRVLGRIDLQEWQNASSKRNESTPSSEPEMLVEFDVKNAPLEVTNEDVFADALRRLIFEGKPVTLHIEANVDAEADTPMGIFVIREIPAKGQIALNRKGSWHLELFERLRANLNDLQTAPFSGGFTDLNPGFESVGISQTTKSSVSVFAKINVTNPTEYSAHIPYIKLKLAHNGTDVAYIQALDLSVAPGKNSGLEVQCLWDPLTISGDAGVASGRKLLSNYVSGLNTTITLRSYEGSIPALPSLGRALSGLEFEFKVPRMRLPGDDDDGTDDSRSHFIKDATLHLWSSTAVFTLASPLPASTLFITSLDATAFYEHDEPVGRIIYDTPFAVPPGISQTPKLPVELELGGAGYDAVKRALGGTLKLDAVADVGVRLGEYVDLLFFQGQGIGAKVRI